MSQKYKNTDNILKDKLLQAEVSPPDSVWNSIESTLNARQRKGALVLYRRLFYAAAAMLILAFTAYYFSRSEHNLEPTKNKIANQIKSDSLPNKADSLSKENIEKESLNLANTDSPRAIDRRLSSVKQQSSEVTQELYIIDNQVETSTSKTKIAFIVLRKPEKPIELVSQNKLNIKALKLFKANGYKRILEQEELQNILVENTSKSAPKGWSIGLAFAPTSIDRSGSIFTPNSDAFYNNVSSPTTYVSEKDIPAYSGGINLAYQISERWSFQTGVYYLKQGQRIENFSVLQNSVNAISSSNSYYGNIIFENYQVLSENAPIADYGQLTDAVSFSSFDADLVQQFELLEIPFIANYKIINRKTVLSLLAGINSGILMGNRVYLADHPSDVVGKTESINSLIYKSVFGINIEYPLSRKLYFNFSPSYKYQLNNFNKNAIESEKLKYLEFRTGLNFRF